MNETNQMPSLLPTPLISYIVIAAVTIDGSHVAVVFITATIFFILQQQTPKACLNSFACWHFCHHHNHWLIHQKLSLQNFSLMLFLCCEEKSKLINLHWLPSKPLTHFLSLFWSLPTAFSTDNSILCSSIKTKILFTAVIFTKTNVSW